MEPAARDVGQGPDWRLPQQGGDGTRVDAHGGQQRVTQRGSELGHGRVQVAPLDIEDLADEREPVGVQA